MSTCFKWEDFITIEEHEDSDKEECLQVEDILILDLASLNTSNILQYQNILISYVASYFNQKVIKNEDGDLKLVSDILHWVARSAEFLAKKIGQVPQVPVEDEIKRSSYQFCDNTCDCNNFYCKNEATCTSHHYVHSLVYTDTISIVMFLTKYNNLDDNEKQNIKKSIETIKFVIDHMYTEFSRIESYMNNAEKYHRDNLEIAGKNRKKFKNISKKSGTSRRLAI
jgi:hypothetical protein